MFFFHLWAEHKVGAQKREEHKVMVLTSYNVLKDYYTKNDKLNDNKIRLMPKSFSFFRDQNPTKNVLLTKRFLL